jgi:hypothetical protein
MQSTPDSISNEGNNQLISSDNSSNRATRDMTDGRNVPMGFENNGSFQLTADFVEQQDLVDANEDVSIYCIIPEDLGDTTDYTFFLLSQFKLGYASKAECERGTRKNGFGRTSGYPGLRCKYCGGFDTGNYFPSSIKNLQSAPANMHKHLLVCAKCTEECRESILVSKSHQKRQASLLPMGSQHAFFERIWQRLHNPKWARDMKSEHKSGLVDDICQKIWERLAKEKQLDYLQKNEGKEQETVNLVDSKMTPPKSKNLTPIEETRPKEISDKPNVAVAVRKPIASTVNKKGSNRKKKKIKGCKRPDKKLRRKSHSLQDGEGNDCRQPFTRDAGYEVDRLFEERVLDLNVGLNIQITDAALQSFDSYSDKYLPMKQTNKDCMGVFSKGGLLLDLGNIHQPLTDITFHQGPTLISNLNAQQGILPVPLLTPLSSNMPLIDEMQCTPIPVSFHNNTDAGEQNMLHVEVSTPLQSSEWALPEIGSYDRCTLLHLLAQS